MWEAKNTHAEYRVEERSISGLDIESETSQISSQEYEPFLFEVIKEPKVYHTNYTQHTVFFANILDSKQAQDLFAYLSYDCKRPRPLRWTPTSVHSDTVEFRYLIARRHRSPIKFIILSCKLRILSYREFKMCVIAYVKPSITTGRPFYSTS
jgi:hypothetical protein